MNTEQATRLSYSTFEAHEYPRMSSHSWTRLSKPAKDLVLRMLERSPGNRITASEVTSNLPRRSDSACRRNLPNSDIADTTMHLHYKRYNCRCLRIGCYHCHALHVICHRKVLSTTTVGYNCRLQLLEKTLVEVNLPYM